MKIALAFISLCGLVGQSRADDRDNSDWWSLIRRESDVCSTPTKEKPSDANFVVAGVDLEAGDPIRDAMEKVAKPSATIQRGDASTSRAQVCFKSSSEAGRFKLIFEKGELASVAYLIDGGPNWSGSDKCSASPKVSAYLSTGSGLRLGMTAAEVEDILGQPCATSNDSIAYQFDSKRFLTSTERKKIKESGTTTIDPDQPMDRFGSIVVKFRGAGVYYIAILSGETQ